LNTWSQSLGQSLIVLMASEQDFIRDLYRSTNQFSPCFTTLN
jgi:hypothetical protein